DHADRKLYDELGFGGVTCSRHGFIQSEMLVQEHLRIKHPRVWKRLEDKRVEDQRNDLAQLTRLQVQLLQEQNRLARIQAGISEPPPDPEPEPEPTPTGSVLRRFGG